MTDDEQMNPDSVSLEDVKEMDGGEFRQYTYLKFEELCDDVSKVDRRQWAILSGIVITILLTLASIFG